MGAQHAARRRKTVPEGGLPQGLTSPHGGQLGPPAGRQRIRKARKHGARQAAKAALRREMEPTP